MKCVFVQVIYQDQSVNSLPKYNPKSNGNNYFDYLIPCHSHNRAGQLVKDTIKIAKVVM